MILFRM